MPPGIVIVGLGPGDAKLLTLEAWHVLEGAPDVYLRTRIHASVPDLPKTALYHSFDDLYETSDTLDEVYERIVGRVLELGRRAEGVVYAVPGHPLVGETAVSRILECAKSQGLATRIVAGVSLLEPTLGALSVDTEDGLQICDATLLAQRCHPNLDPDVPALVIHLDNRHVAGRVKTTLLNLFHEEHLVRVVRGAGTDRQAVREVPLVGLDRLDDLDSASSVYIPPLTERGSLASYQELVARLRGPGGCPWDREQTHASLRSHLLEETHELLAALDADDMPAVREELGDVLLQVLLHAQIATEDGDFRMIDVVQHVMTKLVRRHPHVFGERSVQGTEQVLRNWEQIKREEKGEGKASMLAGIPGALPALEQALEIQRRVARVGFDWPDTSSVADKVREELCEYLAAPGAAERATEFGDLLFSLVNLARWQNLDPESALREANQRFVRRFRSLEQHAASDGVKLEELGTTALDALWEQVKREERM